MITLAPISLYIGDDWPFDMVATDGSPGIGATVLVSGGSGYTTPPTVTFGAPPAGGRIATGTATIASGAVTGVIITDPGIYLPGLPPGISLSGGGGIGALLRAVVGNPIDLTQATVGAEFFTTVQGPATQLTVASGDITMTSAVNGSFRVTVGATLSGTTTAQGANALTFPTRLHVFYTDVRGKKHTIGVQPIIPVRP